MKISINTYQSNHFFENRLYISTEEPLKIQSAIHQESGKEYIGAGVRSYSKPMGWLLSFFGLSSKLTIGNESFYVNNKSFSKFIIRKSEMQQPNSMNEAAKKLNDLFVYHKQNGYDKHTVNEVNKGFKQIIKSNEIKNLQQIVSDLCDIANHKGKSSTNDKPPSYDEAVKQKNQVRTDDKPPSYDEAMRQKNQVRTDDKPPSYDEAMRQKK